VTVPRLAAIALIFIASTLAWFALGASITVRTGEDDSRLAKEVELLWGGPQTQVAPTATIERRGTVTETVTDKAEGNQAPRERVVTRETLELASADLMASRVEVDLDLDHRQRGLLWYDTYSVTFRGAYTFRNADNAERDIEVHFPFPNATSPYDDFVLTLNGQPIGATADLSKGAAARARIGPGQDARLEVSYRSRGVGTWIYAFGREGVSQVRDFALTMTTDFADIDFPVGTMSPAEKTATGHGWRLAWNFKNLVTGQKIGMDLPNRLNPGPLAARITFFAPVSLLFFLTVMVMLGVTSGESLHPMNYFFLAAAFFAFHLLLAYLVDHLSIHLSFALAAAVSLALVVSYLRVVSGMRRALLHAGVAQFIFLVLFSYAFFFEGYTGLTVTVGAVITLFVLMQMTARVPWAEVLARGSRRERG
jgi:inner membrane protein involved in colicin E2 resistance